jgi:hypothetical protein
MAWPVSIADARVTFNEAKGPVPGHDGTHCELRVCRNVSLCESAAISDRVYDRDRKLYRRAVMIPGGIAIGALLRRCLSPPLMIPRGIFLSSVRLCCEKILV